MEFNYRAGDFLEAARGELLAAPRRSAASLPSSGLTVPGVSLTHVAIYARIIINGTRVGVVRTHISARRAGKDV